MSLNALISPNELIYSYDGTFLGERVAQVEPDGQTFEVGSPLFWTPCADDVVANLWYYDTTTQTCELVPVPPPPPIETQDTENITVTV
jgi:hypothetical protein